MRKSKTLHILYILCALCVVNTILSPVLRQSISEKPVFVVQPSPDFNPWLDLLSFPDEIPDGEKDDAGDQEEFLFFGVVSVSGYASSEINSRKIPTQQGLLESPDLSKSKPPPKLIA